MLAVKAFLLVSICSTLCLAGKIDLPKDPNKVAVALDCGSSGSRVCVYYFNQDPHDLILADDSCMNIHPGLSSYASNPRKAGEAMKPLFDHAAQMGVPTGTKVYLAATAGLRALPLKETVDQIIDSVRNYLSDRYAPHLVWAPNYPRVLSGNEEGVFGWAAVNHMLGTLGGDASATAGSLDMGGSSTQITFVPSNPSDVPSGYQFSYPYKDKVYQLYTHSFAGYGYNDARKSVLMESNMVVQSGGDGTSQSTILIDPCALQGYRAQQEVGDQNVTVAGTGSWSDCTLRCKLLLSKNWPCVGVEGSTGVVTAGGGGGFRRGEAASSRGKIIQPCSTAEGGMANNDVLFTDPLSTRFYALSNFKNIEKVPESLLAQALGLPNEAEVGELLAKGKELCSTPWTTLRQKYSDLDQNDLSTYCFGASYIFEVLHDGYHFPTTMKVNFVKHLDTQEKQHAQISWTRGMLLFELAGGAAKSGYSDVVSASDPSSGNIVSSALLLGVLAMGVVGAAGYALVKGPGELREAVSSGVSMGLDKLKEGSHAAVSAAEKGKRIVSVLPSGMPFEIPRVFRAGHSEYEDVDEENTFGSQAQPLNSRLPARGGKRYGAISSATGDASESQEPAQPRFVFSNLFPQLQQAGDKLVRRSKSETALEKLLPEAQPQAESAGTADAGQGAEGGCLVCEGRRKMGVEGLCGLCNARGDDSNC